jgi:hypothetical protein
MPAKMAPEGLRGVEGIFLTLSWPLIKKTKSVNVPPASIPILMCFLIWSHSRIYLHVSQAVAEHEDLKGLFTFITLKLVNRHELYPSLFNGDGFDFDPDIPWKACDLNGCTCGVRGIKKFCIDAVHLSEVVHVLEEYGTFHNFV